MNRTSEILKNRISLLKESNVISAEVAEYVNSVIDMLSSGSYEPQKLETLTTHLAMAAERTRRGELPAEFDAGIWKQVEASAHYSEAVVLCTKIISTCPVRFPDGETKFIIMHLCNLLQSCE